MTDSKITHFPEGTVIEGPDGMRMVQAYTLWSALGLAAHGIMPTRGMTKRKLLDLATSYTKKPYKLSELAIARADVKVWADEMRAALPHEVKP